MSAALFDIPGPRARRRHRVVTVIAAVAFSALMALVIYRLNGQDEFESQLWQDLFQPNIWNAIGQGLVGTLSAAGTAIVLSILFGAFFAVARVSDHLVLRIPAIAIVEFFRAIPVLLLMIFLFLAFQNVIGAYGAVVLALMLYNGAVLAEVFRAGINAVPSGQSEAAYALGMRKGQVLRVVLFPQAVRIMLPAIISQCVVVLKDTALGYIVTYDELLNQGQLIAEFVNHTIVPLALIALIYIAINYTLSRVAVWVERRLSQGRTRIGPPSAGAAAVDRTGGMDVGA